VTYRDTGSVYVCRINGCVRITQADLDELAEQVMLDYLARSDVIDALRAGDHDSDAEHAQIRDQLAVLRTRRDQLADAVAAGTVSVATLVRAEPTLLAEITKLEARQKELSIPSALRGLIEPGADVARRWETAPISTRREIARLLLTPDLISQLLLQPSPRRGPHRTPAHERTHGGADSRPERHRPRGTDCVQSNLPSRIWAVNVVHAVGSSLRTGPDRSLLSRMTQLPSVSMATSTQALPAPLRLDFRH
jgi:hypothetical protein